MADKGAPANPLLLTGKSPDTSLNVQLHPLVLLTITDYITRHTLRSQKGPIVGSIIGQQNGRNYTLEHAYQCQVKEQGGQVLVDEAWFTERLEQYRDVHKVPALDLMALFTLGPVDGPQPVHLPLIQQAQKLTGMDGLMLVLFHIELVDKVQGGKLPISVYESVHEPNDASAPLKFRELVFDVDSGDAEMIGVDFVAKGGGNATAVIKAEISTTTAESSQAKKKGKGKDKEVNGDSSAATLSPEDEELLSSLTAKVNAIKMLNQRINLIKSYLESLPSSYLTDDSSTTAPLDTTNHALLRQIQSMLSRLPLLMSPTLAQLVSNSSSTDQQLPDPNAAPKTTAGEKEKQDVHLTSLLAAVTRSLHEAQGLSQKFAVTQRDKHQRERAFRPGGTFGGGGGGRIDLSGGLGGDGGDSGGSGSLRF